MKTYIICAGRKDKYRTFEVEAAHPYEAAEMALCDMVGSEHLNSVREDGCWWDAYNWAKGFFC